VSLNPGTRLGPYEITAQIGAGGMGEVYRARDTRLDRTVAIKVLPSHVAANPDVRQRFDREARAISSLNHPHICTLYDVGHQDGIDFLVMEYVDGETLAERLSRSGAAKVPALRVEEVLRYGIEIADALDKAHRQGIIHRDLKPANIMLTKSGVKLLDFGLAKLRGDSAPVIDGLTRSASLTGQGTILGTLQYMAPEQLEGKHADARSDIFAFGTVLYEMATGKKAFEGTSQASLIAAILEHDPPPMQTVQPLTPPPLDRLVKTCLAKDPDARWASAHDVLLQLQMIAQGAQGDWTAAILPPLLARQRRREQLAWGGTALLLITTVAFASAFLNRLRSETGTVQPPPRVVRFTVPEVMPFAELPDAPALALSPDGTRLVYTNKDGQLHVRAINRLETRALPGTNGASGPFFSPDGQWVGFVSGSKLKKVPLEGGAPVTLCSVGSPSSRGASWLADDTIVFAPSLASAIFRVSANGGTPDPITTLDTKNREVSHRWPDMLPGGKALIFTVKTAEMKSFDEARIVAQLLDTGERRTIIEGASHSRYLRTGHLVYARAGSLLAVRFDIARLRLIGSPVSVVDEVLGLDSAGYSHYALSADGSLVYVAGSIHDWLSALVWVDRRGKEEKLPVPEREHASLRLSPDGQRLTYTAGTANADIWIHDLARGTQTRLTFGPGNSWWPVWSPDGLRVAYAAERGGTQSLFIESVAGTGAEERLTTSHNPQVPESWSPDGKLLVFSETSPETGSDLWVLPMMGDRRPLSLIRTRFDESQARFSSDGRFMAYVSDESGRNEVYAQPYPGPGGRVQVSTDGGDQPVWARDDRELFYRKRAKMMVAPVETHPTLEVGTSTLLFDAASHLWAGRYHYGASYDVSPRDRRFIMLKGREEVLAPLQATVIVNWFEELKRLVPPK
jgi:eukaryotic-like serine/threonine-protein kinase